MSAGLRWTDDEYRAYLQQHRPQALNLPASKKIVPAPAPDRFLELCAAAGLPMPAREVCFIPGRDFRADYCWPQQRVIVEQQGFRDHSTRKGLRRDYDKLNLAQAAGWKVFQFTPKQLVSVETIEFLRVQLAKVE